MLGFGKKKIDFWHTHVSKKSRKLVNKVLKSGFLNEGKYAKEFEAKLRAYGCRNAILTNSCTSALHIALECCNVRGKEVILPAQTFIATGMAILMAGGIPVFCDIEEDGNIDVIEAKKLINENTAAIIAVHWGGNPCNIGRLNFIAQKHSIPVIEDAAHAMGASAYRMDKHEEFGPLCSIGEISDYTCFSFQAIKGLTTGDGGAICFKNPKNAEKIRKLKWFGMDKYGLTRNREGDRNCKIRSVGYKYNSNDIAAAIGIGNLETLNERLVKRRNLAYEYRYILPNSVTPVVKSIACSSCWLYTVLVEDRERFITHMNAHDIPVSVVDRGIDLQPIFEPYRKHELPMQREFDKKQISIPLHEGLNVKDIKRIVDIIKKGW